MGKPADRVIERDRFKLADNDTKKLSYELVFIPKQEETDSIDLLQALERNNREWAARLAEEKQKAVKQGYEAGFTDGEARARQQIRDQIKPAELALSDVQAYFEQFTEILKPEIEKLVFLLAAKVVGVPVDAPDLKAQIAAEIGGMLHEMADKSSVQIRVADADYDTIQHLVEASPARHPVELIRDASLKPGEYRIETSLEQAARSFMQRLDDFRKASGLRFIDD